MKKLWLHLSILLSNYQGVASLKKMRKQMLLTGAAVAFFILAVSFSSVAAEAQKETSPAVVIGNKDTMRYHLPGMPYYNKVAKYHRVYFNSEQEAISKGYYKAGTGRDLSGAAPRGPEPVKEKTAPVVPANSKAEIAASAPVAPSSPGPRAEKPAVAVAAALPKTETRPAQREENRTALSENRSVKAVVKGESDGVRMSEQKAVNGIGPEYDLKDLYQQALKNSEKIQLAEENVYISQLNRKKAWAVLIPKVTAFGTYNRFSDDKYYNSVTVLPAPLPTLTGSVLVQPEQSGTWGVRADQSFSLSVRELDALKASGQMITKSEYELDAARSDFLLAVASAYYDVLRAKKGLEIAAANMERLTQYRDSVEKRVKVGEVTRTGLLRAEGELSGARADFLRMTNALKLTRAALIRITGIEETFLLKEEGQPEQDVGRFEQLRNTAVASRADLKSYEVQTQIAGEQVKYARGAFWPNVGLFAIYSGADQKPPTTGLVRESMLAGVSLNFPFFEGGLRVAEYKEAKARERQARLAYDDLKKSVDIELQSSCLDLETQKGSLKFLEDQLVFAQDNYNAVLRQYENGLATSLDVMDANALLLSSERNVAEALYAYQLAHLKVRKSSGTLLKFIQEGQ